MEADRLAALESLVEELLKDKPREDWVKESMEKNGLVYSADPIQRINEVLKALHFEEPQKEMIE